MSADGTHERRDPDAALQELDPEAARLNRLASERVREASARSERDRLIDAGVIVPRGSLCDASPEPASASARPCLRIDSEGRRIAGRDIASPPPPMSLEALNRRERAERPKARS